MITSDWKLLFALDFRPKLPQIKLKMLAMMLPCQLFFLSFALPCTCFVFVVVTAWLHNMEKGLSFHSSSKEQWEVLHSILPTLDKCKWFWDHFCFSHI